MIHELFCNPVTVPLQEWADPVFARAGLKVSILRTDLIHPVINGNKFFKLKNNLTSFFQSGCSSILTFGGAYSNHIYAVATAGLLLKIPTIGIIRGDELNMDSNPVLRFAHQSGMRLKFVNREMYRRKEEDSFISELRREFGDFFLLPEGGSNELAVRGTTEIMQFVPEQSDWIACACGTGGTLAGLARGLSSSQRLLGVSVLNSPGYFENQLLNFNHWERLPQNISINYDFHFGGYGRVNELLRNFCDEFAAVHDFRPDEIYNAKLFFAIRSLAERDYFRPGNKIVLINTGGIQNQSKNKETFGL